MRTRIQLSLRTCLAVALALSAATQAWPKGVTLRYTQSQGDKALYRFASSARGKLDVQKGLTTSTVEMSIQMKVATEVTDVAPDGDLRIQAQITSGGVKAKSEGQQDSAPVGNVVANYTISPQGGVRTAELVSGDPPAFPHLFIAFMPDDAFLIGGLAQFPEKALNPGDIWSGVVRIPSPDGGAEEAPYKSKLLGLQQFKGRPCAKIKTTAKSSNTSTEAAPDGSGTITGKVAVVRDTTRL